jgi:nucleotide-binding universal stress UspA family protein
MLRSILAATDLSDASDPVLRAAAALANLVDAEFHAVHALETPRLPYSARADQLSSGESGERRAERAVGEQIERALPPQARPASVQIKRSPVHTAILERAREVGAELIVLGPHRLRRFADRVLGSTADRVIRTAPVPCLLVREPLDLPLRRVMIATDLSEQAEAALDVAIRWVGFFGARADQAQGPAMLQVAHVIPRAYEMSDFAFDEEVILPELGRIVTRALERVGVRPEVEERVSWGDVPADEILAAARSERIDLLVGGTHGHGAIRRALLGSVASSIARAAPCPVLLVPPAATGVEA